MTAKTYVKKEKSNEPDGSFGSYYIESRLSNHVFYVPDKKWIELKKLEETGELDALLPNAEPGTGKASMLYRRPHQLKSMEHTFAEDGSYETEDVILAAIAWDGAKQLDKQARIHPKSFPIPNLTDLLEELDREASRKVIGDVSGLDKKD